MGDTTNDVFREAGHFSPREDRANGMRVALVTEPGILGGIGEGLAIRGYDTVGYTSEPATREQLGELAEHIAESRPDAVVTLVHPLVQGVFLRGLDGRVPLVVLDTSHREQAETSPTTQIHWVPLMPSAIAYAVHEVIEARRRQDLEQY